VQIFAKQIHRFQMEALCKQFLNVTIKGSFLICNEYFFWKITLNSPSALYISLRFLCRFPFISFQKFQHRVVGSLHFRDSSIDNERQKEGVCQVIHTYQYHSYQYHHFVHTLCCLPNTCQESCSQWPALVDS
jgi:hypothetical protein